MTLPLRTLEQLAAVDPDRARAIVKAAERSTKNPMRKAIEVLRVSKDAAVILVGPSHALRRIPWLRLAEVSPARYLLTVEAGRPVESLEVALLDLLETLPPEEKHEREILEELRQLLGRRRRDEGITKFEMLYIVPERRTPRRA